ncbi:MAG: MTH865-like family protein [Methanocella sp. PtaU1.Bin125]|nr:MAG: MTH865-like family protein [Methanocella sp. PtaU1.Bin125]
MSIEKPKYTEHAQAPGASGIKELDMLKVKIVEMADGAAVKFPINNRAELLKVFPKSTPMACAYRGETMTMYQLIQHLDDADFPIKNAGDLATILTTRCFI